MTAPTGVHGQGETGASDALAPCTLGEYCMYFLRLGTLGFGGSIALAGYMQKDLVEERRWILTAGLVGLGLWTVTRGTP